MSLKYSTSPKEKAYASINHKPALTSYHIKTSSGKSESTGNLQKYLGHFKQKSTSPPRENKSIYKQTQVNSSGKQPQLSTTKSSQNSGGKSQTTPKSTLKNPVSAYCLDQKPAPTHTSRHSEDNPLMRNVQIVINNNSSLVDHPLAIQNNTAQAQKRLSPRLIDAPIDMANRPQRVSNRSEELDLKPKLQIQTNGDYKSSSLQLLSPIQRHANTERERPREIAHGRTNSSQNQSTSREKSMQLNFGNRVEHLDESRLEEEEVYRKKDIEYFLKRLLTAKDQNKFYIDQLSMREASIKQFYQKQIEKVNTTYSLMEKMINDEKNSLITKFNKHMASICDTIGKHKTQLSCNEFEIQKSFIDVESNFNNIVLKMEMGPFKEILTKYNNLLNFIQNTNNSLQIQTIDLFQALDNNEAIDPLKKNISHLIKVAHGTTALILGNKEKAPKNQKGLELKDTEAEELELSKAKLLDQFKSPKSMQQEGGFFKEDTSVEKSPVIKPKAQEFVPLSDSPLVKQPSSLKIYQNSEYSERPPIRERVDRVNTEGSEGNGSYDSGIRSSINNSLNLRTSNYQQERDAAYDLPLQIREKTSKNKLNGIINPKYPVPLPNYDNNNFVLPKDIQKNNKVLREHKISDENPDRIAIFSIQDYASRNENKRDLILDDEVLQENHRGQLNRSNQRSNDEINISKSSDGFGRDLTQRKINTSIH